MGDRAGLPKCTRSEIELFLLDDVTMAGVFYRESAEDFRTAMKDSPHRRGSDGDLIMGRASETHTRSLEGYRMALKRFNDFVLHGVVPDEF